ncbi:MAG TPA: 3-hydroxyacyl-CoA dehydrogenase family protein [Bryobacteraceae bacterium]|nr:3-hydroxyacyl-CoA dehydrogenase family protein [Bryobacteraceae bacterium]
MKTIAVIGAGMMGPGIAQVFATRGHPVLVYGRTAAKLSIVKDRVRANLTRMAEYGLVESSDIARVLDRIGVTTELALALRNADVVIEAITEDLAMKQELFAELDRLCPPDTILCSNTSVMSITEIGAKAIHRERIVGTHFYQPPFLVPLVEVIRTEFTAPAHMDTVFELMKSAGKVPVRVQKDVPGFIANRMQHALWREAFALIDEGICDAATVDTAISNSFGLRLPVLGPVANADLVGLDLTIAIHDYVLPHLNVSTVPCDTLRARVKEGKLGFKTRSGFLDWTDESMAATREKLMTYLLEVAAKAKEVQ